MKTLEGLKEELFEKLSDHPRLEAFFKDSLQERMRLDRKWLENSLVQITLFGHLSQDHPLVKLIDSIHEDPVNFGIIKDRLKARDDYDRKMNDVLAELNGYYQLKAHSFERIEALQREPGKTTPDFSAEKMSGRYLFEVKNMRSALGLFEVLLDKYYARKLIYPEKYSEFSVSYEASATGRHLRFSSHDPDPLLQDVIDWLVGSFETIESSDGEDTVKIESFEAPIKDELLRIECTAKRGKFSGMSFGFDRPIVISEPSTRKYYLYHLIKKTIGKVDEALDQLLGFDRNDHYKKYVLLNWQLNSDIRMFFEDEALSISRTIDELVKNVSDQLYVKVLDRDPLP